MVKKSNVVKIVPAKDCFISGENVSGEVVLSMSKALAKKAVTCEMRWLGTEGCRLGSQGGSAVILESNATIWNRPAGPIPNQPIRLPFLFALPPHHPGSTSHPKGHVRYTLTVNLALRATSPIECSIEVPVVSSFESLDRRASCSPISTDSTASLRSCWCLHSGDIFASMKLMHGDAEASRSHVICSATDQLTLKVEITNDSSQEISECSVELVCVASFFIPSRPASGNSNPDAAQFSKSRVVVRSFPIGVGFGLRGKVRPKQRANGKTTVTFPDNAAKKPDLRFMSLFARLCTVEFYAHLRVCVSSRLGLASHSPLKGLTLPLMITPSLPQHVTSHHQQLQLQIQQQQRLQQQQQQQQQLLLQQQQQQQQAQASANFGTARSSGGGVDPNVQNVFGRMQQQQQQRIQQQQPQQQQPPPPQQQQPQSQPQQQEANRAISDNSNNAPGSMSSAQPRGPPPPPSVAASFLASRTPSPEPAATNGSPDATSSHTTAMMEMQQQQQQSHTIDDSNVLPSAHSSSDTGDDDNDQQQQQQTLTSDQIPEQPQATAAATGRAENPKPLEQEDNSCTICMENEIDTVFIPCGHLATCHECSQGLSKCPMCMLPIERAVRTFHAHK